MFGFGRSANEKAVINHVALQFEALKLPSDEAIQVATQIVDEVLTDFRNRGIDPYKVIQGDEQIKREQFVSPRIAAGLTLEDIRLYWNRPLILSFCEMKMREMFEFIVINIAEQRGEDLARAAIKYKKTFPRYGDPARWNPNDKYNAELRDVDADIYPEFSIRIDAWHKKTSDSILNDLISKHGTFNAAIRQLIASHLL